MGEKTEVRFLSEEVAPHHDSVGVEEKYGRRSGGGAEEEWRRSGEKEWGAEEVPRRSWEEWGGSEAPEEYVRQEDPMEAKESLS